MTQVATQLKNYSPAVPESSMGFLNCNCFVLFICFPLWLTLLFASEQSVHQSSFILYLLLAYILFISLVYIYLAVLVRWVFFFFPLVCFTLYFWYVAFFLACPSVMTLLLSSVSPSTSSICNMRSMSPVFSASVFLQNRYFSLVGSVTDKLHDKLFVRVLEHCFFNWSLARTP